MPNSKISKITLPNQETYDIRDGYAMHFVGETTTALTEGATTNPITVDGSDYTAKMGDCVKTSSGVPYVVISEASGSTNNVVWSSPVSITGGTVTSIGTSGVGIQTSLGEHDNDPITSSGTLSLKLNPNSTSGTQTAAAKGNTVGKEYAVGTDSTGVLSVNIPWINTTYTFTSGPNNGYITATSVIDSNDVQSVQVQGLKSAAYKDTTNAYSSTGTDPITGTGVAAALATLPQPMVFIGTLGVNGTISALPTDGTAIVGDTYKVITDGTYAGQAAKIGDIFICQTKTSNTNTWAYVPSGDEPTYSAGSGLTLSGTEFSLSNSIDEQATAELKKIAFDSHGQITGVSAPSTTTVATGLTYSPINQGDPTPSNYYSVSGETLTFYNIGCSTNSNVVTS